MRRPGIAGLHPHPDPEISQRRMRTIGGNGGPHQACQSHQPGESRENGIGKFGLQVQELTADAAKRLKLSVQRGVIVTDVEDNSIAAAQDIQREDVITEVDGKPVTDVQSFREALNKADPKRGVLLYQDRKGTKTFAVLKAGG